MLVQNRKIPRQETLGHLVLALTLVAATLSTGCGPQKSDDPPPAAKYLTGQGFVQAGAGQEAITIDLTAFSPGQQVVLAPYATGDVATIEGGNSSTFNITWKVAKQASSTPQKFSTSSKIHRLSESPSDLLGPYTDLDYRIFWNRFDPLSESSEETFSGAFADLAETHSSALRALSQASSRNLTLATGGCPSTFYVPGSKQVDTASTYEQYSLPSSEVSSYFDGGDHCIVFMSDPVSESSKEAVKTSVAAILDRYKNTIYKDTFAQTGSFVFKPLIVVIDFSGPQWPSAQKAPELQIAGAFFKGLSTQMQRPALYIASDLTKISTPVPSPSARAIFHSTLAHEMQHAITDYFKNRKYALGAESLPIDEGMAHLMEDLFGYGAENFDGYAKLFLSVVPDGIQPALQSSTGGATLSNPARGAAQSLLYFIASRVGGFSFTGGSPAESGGLAFVRAAIKAKGVGPASLSKVVDYATAGVKTWADLVGAFFGALAVDGLDGLESQAKIFDAQAPTAGVTDLVATAGKTFGLQFNNYRGIKIGYSQFKSALADDLKGGIEVSYYQTQPLVLAIASDQKAITFEIPETTGSGVAVVRVK